MYRLYVQLEPKNTTNLGTFPDLLLDKSLENKLELKKISYAVYHHHKLQTAFGDYQYPPFINQNIVDETLEKEYVHYFYESTKNTTVIISSLKTGIWQRLTSISYLFIFFASLVIASIIFNSIVIRRENNFNSLFFLINQLK